MKCNTQNWSLEQQQKFTKIYDVTAQESYHFNRHKQNDLQPKGDIGHLDRKWNYLKSCSRIVLLSLLGYDPLYSFLQKCSSF